MKKLLGTLCAVLILAGCSVSSPLDGAVGDLGNLDGFTRYDFSQEDKQGELTYKNSYSLFINKDKTEVKEARTTVYNGKYVDNGKTYNFNNKTMASLSYVYKAEAAALPSGVTGWDFYKLTIVSSKEMQYNHETDKESTTTDTQKGQIYYYALQGSGTKLNVKDFLSSMPADKAAFDNQPAREYTKK